MNSSLVWRKTLAFCLMILSALAIVLATAGPALANENRTALRDTVPASPSGPADPAELKTFLDDLFAKELEEYHLPGAAVSVVKDGKVFFAKGYGYADLEKNIPVDPEQTVFRIGSAGKLFTWTAVMQLVELGKLDPDADINTYLDFHIPDTYSKPITLKHLLTHTAGFEDLAFETLALKESDLLPAGEWLRTHIPARVRPPGDCAAYSNYGAELAGYIVERISGESYEQYIQAHIFDPLGMRRSSARWQMPSDLRAQAAVGYMNAKGVFQPVPSEVDYRPQTAMQPAGVHASSVTDMARFIIAHLQGGRYSDAAIPDGRILKESTTRLMHSTLYAPDPSIPGGAYGFFDFSDNNQRTLGHSGETLGFNTLLLILPDQNLGVFVAYNGANVGGLTHQHFGFQRAFFDHYYPAAQTQAVQPPADFAERAGRFVGSYRNTRGSYTTLEKIGGLMGGGLEISAPGDGTLLVSTMGLSLRFVEMEPLYFRQVDGQTVIVFREDERGQITTMFTSQIPQYAFEKLNWVESPGFNLALLLVCLLVFVSVFPVAAIRFFRARRLNGGPSATPRGARAAQGILLAVSGLNLLFVVGLVMMITSLGFPRFGISLADKIVLGLGVLAAVLAVAALVSTVLAWKENFWGAAFRTFYTLATAAAVAFAWFLNYWNLLGWRF